MTNQHSETTTPRIYAACLAAYNNGILHGVWIDADRDAWEIYDGISAMLRKSPIADAEEWAIHDHEGFGGVRIEEFAGIDRIAQLAAFITEHGALGAAVLNYYDGDLEEARLAVEDRYLGAHFTLRDYMQTMIEDGIEIPDAVRSYIDWDAMASDALMSGNLFTVDADHNDVHVFTAC